ncbi:hypothetical protein SELMODRAFT_411109 [Selaginella moellendorffii]|uniref:Uncharacterized protein n=1 Tax=Selaginella moellendorffii TaxID=88036 RepID=D8RGL6_SELML|nr:hypothetical protein SELMODRAFT_411109 [Selaginella moellendorffii]
MPLQGFARFLLTCSSKKVNYYEFAKASNVYMLFNPIWTEDELLALNEHNFGHDPEEVRKHFLKWGGTPLYVLEKVWLEAQAEISHAIGLLTSYVDETFTSSRLAPASAYVEEQLLSNLPLPRLKHFLSVEQPDGIWDIQAMLLESFVCNILIPRGGKLQYRELQQDGEFGPVLAGSFPKVGPRYHLERRGGGHEAQQILLDHKNVLFKPSSARNVDWDFIVNGSIYQLEKRQDKQGMVNEMMYRIKKLNVKVKLVLLDIGGICPAYIGTGVIVKGDHQDDIMSSMCMSRT